MNARSRMINPWANGLGLALMLGAALVLGEPAESRATPSQDTAAYPDVGGLSTSATVAGDPLGEFQVALTEQFPDTFGGLYQNRSRTYTAVVVGEDAALRATARSLFQQLPARFGVDVPAKRLRLHFAKGRHSLTALYDIKRQIFAEIEAAPADVSGAGGTYAVGIDTRHNQVVMTADTVTPTNVSAAAMSTRFGGAVRTEIHKAPSLVLSRTADVSPWNSGDQIVSVQGAVRAGCTLGFGVHKAAHPDVRYNLTAGHCGTATWYNTDYYSPVFTSADRVGATVTASTQGIDSQLISDRGSIFMWRGSHANPVSTTITGWANPVVGATVCEEGSFSGERCGRVTQVDQSATVMDDTGYVEHLGGILVTSGANPIPGDSGGPLLYPTIFGPLAGGTIVAVSGSTGYHQQIDQILGVYSYISHEQVVVDVYGNP